MSLDNSREKLKEVVCLIRFVVILDNNGKTIYSKYYTEEFENIKDQKDFEKKICLASANLNVAKNDVDIFTLSNYVIVSKISGEVAIFVGANEGDNEVLLGNFYDIFESSLFEVIFDSLTKEKLMNSYEQLVIIIDEMINEGVVMNSNVDSINDIVQLKQAQGHGSNFISFGSTDTKKEKKTYSLFGNLLSGAKDYLSKTMNY